MKIISDFSATLNKAINRRMLSAWYPIDVSLSGDASRSGFSKGPPVILRAASSLYEKALRKDQTRRLRERVKLAAPVISIGNISVGGTGKSPLTIWTCEFLQKIGLHPAVLSRGYARRGRSPGLVPSLDNPFEISGLFGDEPVMISEYLPSVPVWVESNRVASGMAALERGGVDVLVLDDGFQHLGLYRDLDIVLLDCRNAFGNGFVLPAGPLREPPSNLRRADALVITHAGKDGDAALLGDKIRGLFPGIPVFACRHTLRGIGLTKGEPLFPLSSLLGRKAVVFSGIARPEGFFNDLGKAGLRICDSLSFPNHHRYTMGDFSKIFGSASRHGAEVIITTAKDAIRIPLPFRNAIAVAEMGIDFGPDHESFCSLTRGRLGMTVD